MGGGFTGLSAALNLAERGFKVALIEANRIGWGASGRNGGQINTGLRKSPQELIARFGKQRGKALFDLAEEARAIIWERVERHGIACDLSPGNMLLASKPGDLAWMEEEIACFERDMGYTKARLLDRNAIKAEIASDLYFGGIKDSGGGHLHPLNYALGPRQGGAGGRRPDVRAHARHQDRRQWREGHRRHRGWPHRGGPCRARL